MGFCILEGSSMKRRKCLIGLALAWFKWGTQQIGVVMLGIIGTDFQWGSREKHALNQIDSFKFALAALKQS